MTQSSRRLREVHVRKAMETDELCKFQKVNQDDKAQNFFKTTREVMTIVRLEEDEDKRSQIMNVIENAHNLDSQTFLMPMPPMQKRESAPLNIFNYDSEKLTKKRRNEDKMFNDEIQDNPY